MFNITKSIQNYLETKLKHFKEIKYEEDKVLREFVQKTLDNLMDNPKFTGYWELIDPVSREPVTVTVKEIIHTMENKVSRNEEELKENQDYKCHNLQAKQRSFLTDLTALLSRSVLRNDGLGDSDLYSTVKTTADFTLMIGGKRVIETVKALMDYE